MVINGNEVSKKDVKIEMPQDEMKNDENNKVISNKTTLAVEEKTHVSIVNEATEVENDEMENDEEVNNPEKQALIEKSPIVINKADVDEYDDEKAMDSAKCESLSLNDDEDQNEI